MKIGIVCYPTYGGSGAIATELGKGLSAKGHEIHYITYKTPFRLDNLAGNSYYHQVIPETYPLFEYLPYETALTSKMVEVGLQFDLDLFHVHYAIPHASVAVHARQILASKGKHVKIITTLHGTDITLVGKNPAYEPVVTHALEQSDAITSVSESLRAETLEHFKIKNPIRVVPNFIDLKRFKKRNLQELKSTYSGSDGKIILHASNFRKVKRVEDVITVFRGVCQKINAVLLMVGDGPERAKIEMLGGEGCDTGKIRFLGNIGAIEDLLSIADLFLLPSEFESFGLAALEAMACGVPVITTNTGGSPEVNIQGVTGFMCNPGDTGNMTEKALQILSTKENQEIFSDGAVRRAGDFSLDKILPLYEEIYESLKQKNVS